MDIGAPLSHVFPSLRLKTEENSHVASVDIVRSTSGNFLFYNVDAAVGTHCPNQRLDVLLVQYLLKESSKAPAYAEIEVGAGFTQDAMQISGTWDQYWRGYLDNFELTLQRRGRPVRRDGRIDPVVAGRVVGAIHHMPYMILWLNRSYLQLRPGDYSRMSEAGDCPPELRPALKAQFLQPL